MILIDSSVVLAFVNKERGEAAADGYISEGASITSVNLAEVLWVAQLKGDDPLRLAGDLSQYGLQVVDYTAAHARWFSELKRLDKTVPLFGRDKPLSLGDACCLSAGVALNARIITAEKRWSKVPLPSTTTATVEQFR